MKSLAVANLFAAVLSSGGESGGTVLSQEVVTFVIDGITKVIGILTTPPLGIFLTIGIMGSIVGLTMAIVSRVKNA